MFGLTKAIETVVSDSFNRHVGDFSNRCLTAQTPSRIRDDCTVMPMALTRRAEILDSLGELPPQRWRGHDDQLSHLPCHSGAQS